MESEAGRADAGAWVREAFELCCGVHGIRWTQLQRELGVEQATLRSWRRGARMPGLERLAAMGLLAGHRLTLLDPRGAVVEAEGDEVTRLILGLRAQREARGISQEELARQLGCDPTLVSHWEMRNVTPRPSTAAMWARAERCRIEWRPLP